MANSNAPFFSIIITTYNRPTFLIKAIKSVLEQTYQNYELIIVNDGSAKAYTDVLKYIHECLSTTIVKYYYISNRGRSAARNYGIGNANGEFICFLDDDDIYYKNHLETLYFSITINNKLPALYHTRAYRNVNGELVELKPKNFANDVLGPVLDDMFPIHTVAVHNNILKELKFNETMSYLEDIDLWIRIAISYPIIKNNTYTVEYITHSNNTTQWTSKIIGEKLNSILYFKRSYSHYTLKSRWNNEIYYLAMALADFNKEKFIYVIKHLFIAIKAKPFSFSSRYFISLLLKSIFLNIKRKVFA